MTESLKTQLIKAGVDVNSVLERFMGNEALLERFLKKFPQDENYQKLCSAMEARDLDAAITASHTLKGVCGNLSITPLFDLLNNQVAALRSNDCQNAEEMMPQISKAYTAVTDAISQL